MLQHRRDLMRPVAVASRFDHRHPPHSRRQHRAVDVQVVDHRVEIDLQHRGVALAFKCVG